MCHFGYKRAQVFKNRFLRFLVVYGGFSRFFEIFGSKPTNKKFENLPKNRFSQNRSYTCSDGKYGFKTCLGHSKHPFHGIYHDFEQFKTIFEKPIFYQKCNFLQFSRFLI